MKQFEEISVIAEGAFGVVSKCKNRQTGEIVAIKKMKQRIASFEECLQLKEVKSLRKIKHENVMRLLQVFRENDHLFLVFEMLGDSLIKTIQNHQNGFQEAEIRYIAKQILEGLAYVHKQGFFHRDMKPENLLWGGDKLKIADFGLAREIRSRPPYTEYISTRWYRAPEIVLRHEFYNSPVDLWAVGAIIAELYNRTPLFQGTSETDQLFKICNIMGPPTMSNWPDGVRLANKMGLRLPQNSPQPLSIVIPTASPEAIDLIAGLLRYDPHKRLSAAQALAHPYFNGEMLAPSQIGVDVPKPIGAGAQPVPQPINRPKAEPRPKVEPRTQSEEEHTDTTLDPIISYEEPKFNDIFEDLQI